MGDMQQPCVWILGGPGAGKGTQCSLLATKYNYAHLSTGDLLRAEVLAGTERWGRLFETMGRGELVPDDEVIDLLATSMEKMKEAPGFLIDGFPANLKQAEIFVEKLQSPHKIILLEVPEAVMTPRLKDGINFNDQDDTIKKRIFTYLKNTQPTIERIIEKWSTSSKRVNANRTKEAVFEDLEKIFDSWIGDHGSNSYTVVCDDCNRNTVTMCPHINHGQSNM